jgi:hypothetical protein
MRRELAAHTGWDLGVNLTRHQTVTFKLSQGLGQHLLAYPLAQRGCRARFWRPNTGINESVPTVSNAPMTLGSSRSDW